MEKKLASHKSLQNTITNLRKTICYQEKLLFHQNIPKKYKPLELLTIQDPNDSYLLTNFETDYAALFLQHLQKILAANTGN